MPLFYTSIQNLTHHHKPLPTSPKGEGSIHRTTKAPSHLGLRVTHIFINEREVGSEANALSDIEEL
jgi:hypothetical protein